MLFFKPKIDLSPILKTTIYKNPAVISYYCKSNELLICFVICPFFISSPGIVDTPSHLHNYQ